MNDIWTKDFWKAAGTRAIRTVAETALSVLSGTALLESANWKLVISSAIMSGVLTILAAVASGLPEVEKPDA